MYLNWFRRMLWLINSAALIFPLGLLFFTSYDIGEENRSSVFFIGVNGRAMYFLLFSSLIMLLGINLASIFWLWSRKAYWHGSWIITIVEALLLVVVIACYYCFMDSFIETVVAACSLILLGTNSWAFIDFHQGFKGWGKSLFLYFSLLLGAWFLVILIQLLSCTSYCFS